MIIRPIDTIYIGLLSLEIFITLLIGSYAYRGYRDLRDSRLLNLHLGFTVIGGGLLVELTIFIVTHITRPFIYMLIANYVSAIAQVLGYLIIVIGYYRVPKDQMLLSTLGVSTIFPLMTIYLGSSILIIFILYRVLVNYVISRDRMLIYSISAFTLLSLSYILLSIGVARPESYLRFIGNFIRLLGFTLLTYSIYRSSRG